MNLLTQTVRVYRNNVGHLRVPPVVSSIGSVRSLSTSQWKKYLTILDVPKDSTTKEIKDSFLKLSKVYHPDNKTTGSHTKFVELKEAYDALKDGHPTTTASMSSTYSNSYRYNNYYDTDPTWQAHRAYRDRQNDYTYGQSQYGFGGPYRNSSTPWEDLKRDQEYRRQKAQYNSYRSGKGRGLINVTIIMSTMAWIVIYSSVLLIWDYNSSLKKELITSRTRYDSDYQQYQDYLKKKELARIAREAYLRNPKYESQEEKDLDRDYIRSNNQRVIKMMPPKVSTQTSSPPSSPSSTLPSAGDTTSIDLKSSANLSEPEVVGAL